MGPVRARLRAPCSVCSGIAAQRFHSMKKETSMMMNMAQKLISSHLASPSGIAAGEEIYVKIEQTLTHDITAVMCYLAFEALNLPRVRTELSVSYIDHNLLYIDTKAPDDHIFLQGIARKYGIYLSRAGNGICHVVHCSRFGKPCKSLLGTDSHTTASGAIGMLAIGAGGMDVAAAMAGLPVRLKMPEIVNVRLVGKLRPGVAAKDVILEMLRRYTVKGGAGKIFEYTGEGAEGLGVFERLTIANMGAELGATTSVFPADETVRRFLCAQGRGEDYAPLYPDEGCAYDAQVEIDLASLEPMVACPHAPDRVMRVREAGRVPVNQVYIGSCTNGSYADIAKAAAVLRGRTVHENVSLTVSPGSRQIFSQLLADGIIGDLVDSGARITEIACGACPGIGQVPPTDGVSVRTSNRNFKGRGGSAEAELYLASPEVAAATAVAGVLCEAKEVMDDIGALARVQEPERYKTDDRMIVAPAQDGSGVPVVRGPNIKPLPINAPPADEIVAKIALKALDNVSTDDITPADAQLSSMRSNIPLIAQYAFSRYAPEFVPRIRDLGAGFIVAGENYGQGSSREHAAITPMFWGIKAVIAKSFARIHRNNLVNHGVLPLVFEDPKDYERVALLDTLRISGAPEQIRSGHIELENLDKGFSFFARLEVSFDEREILLCGGLLPYMKRAIGSKGD